MSNKSGLRHEHEGLQGHYQLLINAVESIRDYAIFMLDPTGIILTWNKGAEHIVGYSEAETVGKHFSIFYTPEDLARRHPQEELKVSRTEGQYQEEGWRVRRDGVRFWASVLINRITDENGELMGFSQITRDLTERRQTEVTLRASEERFRQLVAGVKDYAIFLLDANGIVATWNEGAERLKGYTPDEIIGQHFSKFYPPEDIAAGKTEYELEEASLTGRFEDEGWRLRKDGTRFWANVIITAIRDSKGRVTGFSKVTRDLTERRRAEERLRRANEDLEKRVAKRTEELTKAKNDLERAIASRDEFLSIASHELKTPITSLKLQTQLLRARVDAKTGNAPSLEKLETTLDMIARQSDRLAGLIEYMLDVSRVQIGKFTFSFESGNLSELVKSVLSQWSEPLRSSGCSLSMQIDEGVVGEFDSYRLEQVMANLLLNAIKYAPGKPVLVTLKRQDQMAVLTVKDQGAGIEADKQDIIFERYERGGKPSGGSGLGLGLFVARTIVDGHHGTISVQSRVGEGAAFIVRLPLNVSRVSELKS